jgi:predicted transcriptional regulator
LKPELAILRVLWERGASTVRQVHDALAGSRGYTTTLKLLQIMTEKGLVTRDGSARTHVYAAAQSSDRTRRQIVADVIQRAFGGSAASLVLHALSTHRTSPEELAAIRELLDTHWKTRK